MKDISCIVLGYLQRRNITDTLDGYVVLAFFLTLFITVVVFFLLVKYITYNIQKDKERQRLIAERKVLPKRVEDEEESDSDDDLMWNESSEEADENAKHIGNEDMLEVVSTDILLDTNYVEAEKGLSTNESKALQGECVSENDDDLDMKWLGLWLLLDPTYVFNVPMTQPHFILDSSTESEFLISASPMYQEHLLQIVKLRGAVFIHLINFTLELLLHERITSEDETLLLKAKFEQEFEKSHHEMSGSEFNTSKEMVKILRMFLKDLKELNVKRTFMEVVVSLFFNQPLNCLKIYLMSVSGAALSFKENSEVILNCIAESEKALIIMKSRFIYIKEAAVNVQASSTHISEFESEIKIIFSEFQSQVHYTLKSVCRDKMAYTADLSIKLEQNINSLKYNIFNSTGSNDKKLKTFGEGMMSAFISHLEDHSNPITKSKSQDIRKVIERLKGLEEGVMLKMQNAEDQLFSKLDLKKKEIKSIFTTVHNTLKEQITLYNDLKDDTTTLLIQKQENLTKFMNLSIEYIVKFVSSRYRMVLASDISYIRSWPSLSEECINKLEQSIRGKMSMVSFDLVFGFVSSFLMEIQNQKHALTENVLSIPLETFFTDCFQEETQDFNVSEFINQSSLKSLQNSIKPFVLPDEMLSYNFNEHYNIVMKAFNNLSTNLGNLLKQHIQSSCQNVFTTNIEIFEASRTKLNSVQGSQRKKSASSKYMSRKGSSFKEKTINTKLMDLYHGLLDVKEHRYNEEFNEQKQRKTKAKGPNICMKYLNMQTDFLEHSLGQECSLLYQNDQYYMREMMWKKILQTDEEGNGEETRDEREKIQKVKSPTSDKSKSPKKSTISAMKRRKSRKVADVN